MAASACVLRSASSSREQRRYAERHISARSVCAPHSDCRWWWRVRSVAWGGGSRQHASGSEPAPFTNRVRSRSGTLWCRRTQLSPAHYTGRAATRCRACGLLKSVSMIQYRIGCLSFSHLFRLHPVWLVRAVRTQIYMLRGGLRPYCRVVSKCPVPSCRARAVRTDRWRAFSRVTAISVFLRARARHGRYTGHSMQ